MQRLQEFGAAALALGAALFHCSSMSASAASAQNAPQVYIGTYTSGTSKGIYLSRFDSTTGKLSAPELAAESTNPSFIAVHPNGRWLYAAGEVSSFGGKPEGVISAFQIVEGTGRLDLINQQPSGGAGPCHLALDNSGKCLLVANYNSGSVAALPVEADGRLGASGSSVQHHGSSVNRQRQEGPHAHFIIPDPGNNFALACDLGLDKVLVYRLNPAQASLTPNNPPSVSLKPGSGPRHLAFHPNGRFVYVISELSSSVTAFSYDPGAGTLKELETRSTLPPDFKGESSCAEIQVHPSGRFLYGSNRGHNSIAVFGVNPKDGRIQRTECVAGGGKTPRHFTLDSSGRWLLVENQDSNNVVVFAVDPNTGHLTPTGEKIEVGAPVCLIFAP
jgi:6-phosphogluconolactonase